MHAGSDPCPAVEQSKLLCPSTPRCEWIAAARNGHVIGTRANKLFVRLNLL